VFLRDEENFWRARQSTESLLSFDILAGIARVGPWKLMLIVLSRTSLVHNSPESRLRSSALLQATHADEGTINSGELGGDDVGELVEEDALIPAMAMGISPRERSSRGLAILELPRRSRAASTVAAAVSYLSISSVSSSDYDF
jgi:hypothetical protein